MSTKNRGDRIQLLQKVVMKNFTPVLPPDDRTVLEHLLYACCLEDAPYEAADESFHRLQESFFDWNEVRVTTVSELRDTLHTLPDAAAAAVRIKRCLQSIFENRYSFDLQDLVKMNQGKALQELEKLSGISKFGQAYVTQHALGGHAIPVSESIMHILQATEVVSEAEAAKGQTPGLERTVPKNKGIEFASCLHQLAVMAAQSPGSKQAKAVLKEAGASDIAKKETVKPSKAEADKGDKSEKAGKLKAEEAAVASGADVDAPTSKSSKKAAPAKPTSAAKSGDKKPTKKGGDKPAPAKKAAKASDTKATAKTSKRKPK